MPYRDSVLTKLLKNALGGNSKTIMVRMIVRIYSSIYLFYHLINIVPLNELNPNRLQLLALQTLIMMKHYPLCVMVRQLQERNIDNLPLITSSLYNI